MPTNFNQFLKISFSIISKALFTALFMTFNREFPKLNSSEKTLVFVAIAIKTVPTSASESPFVGPAFPVVAMA